MAGSRTYRTKVLVLDKTKLKETDLILTMLDERGRQVRAVAKGARKPGGRLAARCELFCTVDMLLAHGRSLDVVSQPSLWRRRSALRPIARRLAPQARSPRSHACARSRTPRTRLPLPLRNGRLPWSAAGSTLRIWIYLWRHMSLSCCRTLAIDQIFRPACCAETPCCRIFHHRRAGSCADRARRAFRVPSWYRLVRSHGFAPSCP